MVSALLASTGLWGTAVHEDRDSGRGLGFGEMEPCWAWDTFAH